MAKDILGIKRRKFKNYLKMDNWISLKKGPGHVLELLRDRHPYQYNLPSENEICQEITKLMKKAKK